MWGEYANEMSLSAPLPPDRKRTKLIQATVTEFAAKKGIPVPHVKIRGTAPASFSPVGVRGLITVERAALEENTYNEDDVRAILGHELTHIANRDSMKKRFRFFNPQTSEETLAKELAADRGAVELAGCVTFRKFVIKHETLIRHAAMSKTDPHPSYEVRLGTTTSCADQVTL